MRVAAEGRRFLRNSSATPARGGLRGAQALSALALQSYSEENAALLRQPALLDHFEKQLAGMPSDVQNKPILVSMRNGIQRIRTLLTSDDGPIRKQMVEKIAHIAEELLKGLSSKSGNG